MAAGRMCAGKAVDAFLNFETVKLFGNSNLEVRQYDTSLTAYQASVPPPHLPCMGAT